MPRVRKTEANHDKVVPTSIPEVQLAVVRSIKRDTIDEDAAHFAVKGYQFLLQGSLRNSKSETTKKLEGKGGYHRNVMRGVAKVFGVEQGKDNEDGIVRHTFSSGDDDAELSDSTYDEFAPPLKKCKESQTKGTSVFQKHAVQSAPQQPRAVLAQPAHAPPAPQQPVPAQAAPAQAASAQATPAQAAPAQPTPEQPTPEQPTPEQLTPARPPPIKPTPSQLVPAQLIPAQPTPAQHAPPSKSSTKQIDVGSQRPQNTAQLGQKRKTSPLKLTVVLRQTTDKEEENESGLDMNRPAHSKPTSTKTGQFIRYKRPSKQQKNGTEDVKASGLQESAPKPTTPSRPKILPVATNKSPYANPADEQISRPYPGNNSASHSEAPDVLHPSEKKLEATTPPVREENRAYLVTRRESPAAEKRAQKSNAPRDNAREQHTPSVNHDKEAKRGIFEPGSSKASDTTTTLKGEAKSKNFEKTIADSEGTEKSKRTSLPAQLKENEIINIVDSTARSAGLRVFLRVDVVEILEEGPLPGTWMFNHKSLRSVDYLSPQKANDYFWIRKVTDPNNNLEFPEGLWQLLLVRNFSSLCDLVSEETTVEPTLFIQDPRIYVFDSTSLGVQTRAIVAVRNVLNGTLRVHCHNENEKKKATPKQVERIKSITNAVLSHVVLVNMPTQPLPTMSGMYLIANINFLCDNTKFESLLRIQPEVDNTTKKDINFGKGKKRNLLSINVISIDASSVYNQEYVDPLSALI